MAIFPTRRRFLGTISLSAAGLLVGCEEESPKLVITQSPGVTSNGTGSSNLIAVMKPEDLRDRIENVLQFTETRVLRVNDRQEDGHAAWQILHGILAFGKRFHVEYQNEMVPALDWILKGGELTGFTLRPMQKGLSAVMAPGSKTGQGHKDQWIAVISQCDVGIDDPIIYYGKTYKIRELVTQCQWEVFEGMEASWTLIGLANYLPIDAEWEAGDGQTWSFEKLMEEEAKDIGEIHVSACGGTHRLIGMAMCLQKYCHANNLSEDDLSTKLTGGWKTAYERIRWAISQAAQLQQANGAFSTNYFQRSSGNSEIQTQIGATGHIVEFLSLAVRNDEIDSDWLSRSCQYLCSIFEQTQSLPVECGALYHAAHGLQIYRYRRFGLENWSSEDKS